MTVEAARTTDVAALALDDGDRLISGIVRVASGSVRALSARGAVTPALSIRAFAPHRQGPA